MAQMISQARTKPAQTGGGQRFFGGGGGMGIKGKRTSTEANVGVDLDAAKKAFGHMTPEEKQIAGRKMQEGYERMVAADPEAAELHRKSKQFQRMAEKIAPVGGFPFRQRSDGTWDIIMRSPEQKAMDDDRYTPDRAIGGQYDSNPNQKALRGYQTQTPMQGRGQPTPRPTQPHRMVGSTGGPVRPHRIDQAGSPAMPSSPASDDYSQRVLDAQNYKSPHDQYLDTMNALTNNQMAKNDNLRVKENLQTNNLRQMEAVERTATIKLQHAQMERELAPGFIDDNDQGVIDGIRNNHTQRELAEVRYKNALGPDAHKPGMEIKFLRRKAASTSLTVDEMLSFLNPEFMGYKNAEGLLDLQEARNIIAGYTMPYVNQLDSDIAQIMDDTPTTIPPKTFGGVNVPLTGSTEPGSEEGIEDFGITMGGILTTQGQLIKKTKSTRDIDGHIIDNWIRWVCDKRIPFENSNDRQAVIMGIGISPELTKEAMTEYGWEYTPIPGHPIAGDFEEQPNVIDKQKNTPANKSTKPKWTVPKTWKDTLHEVEIGNMTVDEAEKAIEAGFEESQKKGSLLKIPKNWKE